jgi:aldose sugar dehydrogenase
MKAWRRAVATAAILPALAVAQTRPDAVQQTSAKSVRIEQLATLEFPWGMALLPDGRLLVTEKPGRLRVFANGKLSEPVEGVPATAYRPKQGEQGGLLDVAVDPQFARNEYI